MIKCMCYWLSN